MSLIPIKAGNRHFPVHQGVLQSRAKALACQLSNRDVFTRPIHIDLDPSFVELYLHLLYRRTLPVLHLDPKEALHQLTGLYVLGFKIDDVQTRDIAMQAILAYCLKSNDILPRAETLCLMYTAPPRCYGRDFCVDLLVYRADTCWLLENLCVLPSELRRDLIIVYSIDFVRTPGLFVKRCNLTKYLEGK
jgi:hypothetical protein